MQSRELFEQASTDEMSWINSLIGIQEENEVVDFKQLSKGTIPLQDDDKKNLSKTVSAFANNSGGILVWGIECRKNSKGEDVAQKLHPISGLKAVETAIRSLVPQVTSGSLGNIEYKLIEESAGTNSGFLVMYVPVAKTEPIMATASGLNRYYTRNSESCIAMSHVQVGDMFARRLRPRLSFVWKVIPVGGNSYRLLFGLKNTGHVIAKYIGVTFKSSSSFDAHEILPYGTQLELSSLEKNITYAQTPEQFFIQPGLTRLFLVYRILWDDNQSIGPYTFSTELWSNGGQNKEDVVITKEQIAEGMDEAYRPGVLE